jgi:hypothetical protein
MTPEAQRIAIAKACPGVFRIWEGATSSLYFTPGSNVWILTDILNDLNAMHEAEKALTEEQINRYITTLCLEVQPTPMLHHATAAQRAEAFLRTIGKWEESA